jgi:NTP pyrophosphatase (non-canonical NTP hydrolase)
MDTLDLEHNEMVKALAKPGDDILVSLTASQCHLLHMAIGVSGEAGELIDAIKKNAIYEKPLDLENVIEELGDLEFYMAGLRHGLGITREQCLNANIEKLAKRYSDKKYSNAQAQDRADKQ